MSGEAQLPAGIFLRLPGRDPRRVLCAGDGERAQRGPHRSRSRRCRISPCIAPGISACATTPRSGGFRCRARRSSSSTTTPAVRRWRRALRRGDQEARAAARLEARHRLRAARRQGQGMGHRPHARRDDAGARPQAAAGAVARRFRTASTRRGARCRCACFTRAPRRPASRRWSSTGASGTTRRRRSARLTSTTGRAHPAAAFRYLSLGVAAASRARWSSSKQEPGAWVIPPPEELETYRGIRL